MIVLPPLSISALEQVKACPEHLCRLAREHGFWGRHRNNELAHEFSDTESKKHAGRWTRVTRLNDLSYSKGYERRSVLVGQSFLSASKKTIASGLIEPKKIVIGDKKYRELDPESPRCDLCESGDMVLFEMRFRSSKYTPATGQISRLAALVCAAKKKLFRYYDLWEQRRIRDAR